MRSKWSRVLRYAAEFKDLDERVNRSQVLRQNAQRHLAEDAALAAMQQLTATGSRSQMRWLFGTVQCGG